MTRSPNAQGAARPGLVEPEGEAVGGDEALLLQGRPGDRMALWAMSLHFRGRLEADEGPPELQCGIEAVPGGRAGLLTKQCLAPRAGALLAGNSGSTRRTGLFSHQVCNREGRGEE